MVARIAAVLGGPRRALALAGLTAAIAVYTAGADHLWRAGLWPDVLFIALVLIPTTLALVLLLLPLAFKPWLLPVALALAVVAVAAGLADLDVVFNLTKLFALVLFGFWFLSFFENVAWAALVAVIIPSVDTWSVFFGPTGKITSDHPTIFEHISSPFAFPAGRARRTSVHQTSSSLALFVAAARRLGLRVGWTWFAMSALTACTLILSVKAHRGGLPALPIAFGFLLANADLLWRALRRRGTRPRSHLQACGCLRPRGRRDRADAREDRAPDTRAPAVTATIELSEQTAPGSTRPTRRGPRSCACSRSAVATPGRPSCTTSRTGS